MNDRAAPEQHKDREVFEAICFSILGFIPQPFTEPRRPIRFFRSPTADELEKVWPS